MQATSTEVTSMDGSGGDSLARVNRATYVAGSLIFIVIGALHTLTQLTTLSSDDVQAAYRAGGPIDVNGSVVDGWHLFAGTSLLMGCYAIALGATNLAALFSRPPAAAPAPVAAVTIAMLIVIVVVGRLHLTAFQAVGGAIGILLFIGPATAPLVARGHR